MTVTHQVNYSVWFKLYRNTDSLKLIGVCVGKSRGTPLAKFLMQSGLLIIVFLYVTDINSPGPRLYLDLISIY